MGAKLHRQEGIDVVRFSDRELISDEQILRATSELRKVLDSTSTGVRLLIDFRDVDVVASMMLADLVVINKTAKRKGVTLQLFGLSADVKRVIETCKLDQVFDILTTPPSELT